MSTLSWRKEKPLFLRLVAIITRRAKSNRSAFYCVSKPACKNSNCGEKHDVPQWNEKSHVRNTLLDNYLKKRKANQVNFSSIFEKKTTTKNNNKKQNNLTTNEVSIHRYWFSESKREKQQQTVQNLRRVQESRYTSAGVGIFSLGLVTTLALLFICGYAENRNRDALIFLVANAYK